MEVSGVDVFFLLDEGEVCLRRCGNRSQHDDEVDAHFASDPRVVRPNEYRELDSAVIVAGLACVKS